MANAIGVLGLLAVLLVTPTGEALQNGTDEKPLASRGAGTLTLTIYQGQDLALIEDLRVLQLVSGITDIRIGDVSRRLFPDSVQLEAIDAPEALQILNQRFEAPSMSLEALLRAHIGEEIEVFAPGGLGTYRGRLVGTQGGIILREDTGQLRVIQDASRFRFPAYSTPEPTLHWTLRSDLEGSQSVRLSYLSRGLDWQATYSAVLDAGESQLDLTSWVSISNESGMDFDRAQLNLIAGQINRVRPAFQGFAMRAQAEAAEAAPGAPGFEERAAFEYHLYTLRRPATLPDGQSVQLSFVQATGLPVTKRYIYDAQIAEGVQVWIEFENGGDLSRPLPAGIVQLYQRTLQGLQFIGEDRISHTPVGERVELLAGVAFDIVAERTLKKREIIGERFWRETVQIVLTNRKAETVLVQVREHPRGDWKITKNSQEFTRLDAQTIEFRVPLASGQTAIVEYTVEYRR
jgi:hypothetical protein